MQRFHRLLAPSRPYTGAVSLVSWTTPPIVSFPWLQMSSKRRAPADQAIHPPTLPPSLRRSPRLHVPIAPVPGVRSFSTTGSSSTSHTQLAADRAVRPSLTNDMRVCAWSTSLQEFMAERGDPERAAGQTKYMKVIPHRGLRIPEVERALVDWLGTNGDALLECGYEEQAAFVYSMCEGKFAEDKCAGITFLGDYMFKRQRYEWSKLLLLVDQILRNQLFFEWGSTDRLVGKLLTKLLTQEGLPVAEEMMKWIRSSPVLWQRRAAVLSFKDVCSRAPLPSWGCEDMVKEAVGLLVVDDERFIQTGVGWLLADLSKKHTALADALVEKHFANLSAEVIRRHTRFLPKHEEYKERLKERPRSKKGRKSSR